MSLLLSPGIELANSFSISILHSSSAISRSRSPISRYQWACIFVPCLEDNVPSSPPNWPDSPANSCAGITSITAKYSLILAGQRTDIVFANRSSGTFWHSDARTTMSRLCSDAQWKVEFKFRSLSIGGDRMIPTPLTPVFLPRYCADSLAKFNPCIRLLISRQIGHMQAHLTDRCVYLLGRARGELGG
ncbi:hypothetical protein BD410DRAFT_846095 [Rickenella mellea]|uniref:Uncharacterized protein n=1 Tax=Rickenella mellea TaxID=50990 RepID=A0A4Y7PG02_9AGAM|nr:hypothetical protein BD410DRAFT_846095 [Rickenella mellea]